MTAFPDSNTGVSGDVDFVFRMRKDNVPLIPGLPRTFSYFSQFFLFFFKIVTLTHSLLFPVIVPATTIASKKNSHLYGYVLFRQRKDESLKRGYFQKSVLLLSFHPFDGLFKEMIRLIAPSYFELGSPLFEAVCLNIASW